MIQREYTSLPFTEYTTYAYEDRLVPITQIIIHSTVGTVQSAISVFSNPNAVTSAHYIVGNDGKLYAGLEEYEVAYHCGNYPMNQASIGIEHEWYQGLVISDKLYQTSAKLVADICKFYGLGCNRGVVKMHKEIVPTSCPNLIDVDRIVREAQAILTPPTPPVNTDLTTCLTNLKIKTDLETFLRGQIQIKDTQIGNLKTKLDSIKALTSY